MFDSSLKMLIHQQINDSNFFFGKEEETQGRSARIYVYTYTVVSGILKYNSRPLYSPRR